MTRLQDFINKNLQDMSEYDICCGLQNGDIEKPEWLCWSDATNGLKIWDGEEGCESWGAITLEDGKYKLTLNVEHTLSSESFHSLKELIQQTIMHDGSYAGINLVVDRDEYTWLEIPGEHHEKGTDACNLLKIAMNFIEQNK